MKISTLALTCLLLGVGSCSRGDDFQSGGKLLEVNVQMASSSPMPTPMLTRGATASPIISDTVDMGNDLVMVATSQPRQTEEALTRGTPIKSAANLPSMNVKVYNSGAGAFSSSTALKTTLKGTNSGGAWSLSPSYMIVGGEKNTYMAYSPIEDANNGITVAANGRTLTYTAPAAVANHPDLCSAAIIKDDVSGNLSLAMQHRLVAVGIKVSADNVTINTITFENIKNSGVLNLETGVWSGVTGSASFSPALSTSTPGTGSAMNDITAANGYLMLPPQTFTADNQTITVKYTYTGGSQETKTFKLKDLTGGKWDAGQIVMYEIQLKAKFSLTFSPASLTLGAAGGTASFTYSTNSPRALDPEFTNKDGHTWITNISVDRTNKRVTFNYAATTTEGNRSAAIRGTAGFTTTDIGLTQSLIFSISPTSGTIAGAGGSQTVNVTASAGVKWSVDMDVSKCTASPTSGTGTGGAQVVTLTIGVNNDANRSVSAAFKVTSPIAITRMWSVTQAALYIEIKGLKWAAGNLVANGANGAKIGAPHDGGLYFQFGSLLGWKGGATGDGTLVSTKTNGSFYGGATFNAANEIAVKPAAFTTIGNIGGTWPSQFGTNLYYFGYNTAPYSTAYTRLSSFAGFTAGSLANKGVGDPCRYYLGYTWRLPTAEEFKTLCNNVSNNTYPSTANAAWTRSPAVGMNFNNNSTKLFIPASGQRRNHDGAIAYPGSIGYYWSGSVNNDSYGYYLLFTETSVYPQAVQDRRYGFPVRCVR